MTAYRSVWLLDRNVVVLLPASSDELLARSAGLVTLDDCMSGDSGEGHGHKEYEVELHCGERASRW
jgi:hypothetical protein